MRNFVFAIVLIAGLVLSFVGPVHTDTAYAQQPVTTAEENLYQWQVEAYQARYCQGRDCPVTVGESADPGNQVTVEWVYYPPDQTLNGVPGMGFERVSGQ